MSTASGVAALVTPALPWWGPPHLKLCPLCPPPALGLALGLLGLSQQEAPFHQWQTWRAQICSHLTT